MFLFVMLFVPITLFCMERQHTELSIDISRRSPFVEGDDYTPSPRDDDELCEFAMSSFDHPDLDVIKHVKPHLKEILKKKRSLPYLPDYESNADVIRRIKSSPIISENDTNDMQKFVLQAIDKAFSEKEEIIEAKQKRIKEKYSGSKTAVIAAVTGVVSTCITAGCSALVAIYGRS